MIVLCGTLGARLLPASHYRFRENTLNKTSLSNTFYSAAMRKVRKNGSCKNVLRKTRHSVETGKHF